MHRCKQDRAIVGGPGVHRPFVADAMRSRYVARPAGLYSWVAVDACQPIWEIGERYTTDERQTPTDGGVGRVPCVVGCRDCLDPHGGDRGRAWVSDDPPEETWFLLVRRTDRRSTLSQRQHTGVASTAIVKHGRITHADGLHFIGLPATCSFGSASLDSTPITTLPVSDKGKFSSPANHPLTIGDTVTFTLVGQFIDHGRKAKGTLTLSSATSPGTADSYTDCTTADKPWTWTATTIL